MRPSAVVKSFTRSIRQFHMSALTAADSTPEWKPPAKIEELFAATAGNKFAGINSPVAGAREEKELPVGAASVQLYSLFTPNGQKVSILFEELDLEYDAHVINIGKGEQFTSGFVKVNPNSKIPACVDKNGPNGESVNLFESASIVQYFAEKHGRFIPTDDVKRKECFNWVYWQMGGFGPFCGQFGHFFVYAPADKLETRDYGASRYGMEVQRLCSVLDQHLAKNEFLAGDEYSIADMVVFPWFNQLQNGYIHSSGRTAADFLTIDKYTNAVAWAQKLKARPQVQRGLQVCHANGQGKPWLSTLPADA